MSNTGGSILEYGPAGFAPGTGTTTGIVTSPYTISGLTSGTAYDIWAADTCSGDTSAFAALNNVSTAIAPVPTALASFSDTIIGGQFTVYLDASGSTNATAYSWDFGNGVTGSGAMDTVVYLGNGVYNIVLTATNACGTSADTIAVNVNIGLIDNPLASSLNVYPNPAQYSVNVSFREVGSADVQITLRDAQGRNVINMNDRMQSGNYSKDLDVSSLARGIYMLEIKSGSLTAHRRISIK
jgi:chitodextrinase